MSQSFGVVHRITTTADISAAQQVVHISPEKAFDGTVQGLPGARHPGVVYRPLMVMIAVDTADVDTVTLDLDHGDGAGFDITITSAALASQQVIFDLAGDFPGLLIFPKASRTAPDSLTITVPVEAATTASITVDVELLESTG